MKILLIPHTDYDSNFKVGSFYIKKYLDIRQQDNLTIYPYRSPRKFKFSRDILSAISFIPARRININSLRVSANRFNSILNFIIYFAKVKNIDAVIFDEPIMIDFIKILKKFNRKVVIIFRMTDWYSDLVNSRDSLIYLNYTEKSCKISDTIYVTNKSLFNRISEDQKPKCKIVNNGTDLESGSISNFISQRRQKIVYVGAIDDRIDLELIELIAKENNSVEIHIYGNTHPIQSSQSNIFFHGVVEHDQLFDILSNCNIGILPFKNRDSNHARFPMKVFEYLSAGLHVVAMPFESMNEAIGNEGFTMSESIDHASYIESISSVIIKIDSYSPSQYLDIRRSISYQAQKNSWRTKVDKIIEDLYNEKE